MKRILSLLVLLGGLCAAQTPSQFASLKKCEIAGCTQNSAGAGGCYITVNTAHTADSDCAAYVSPDDGLPPVYDGSAGTIYTDLVFGTKIKRITNQHGMKPGSYAPKYSPQQAWSKDGTYLLLGGPGGGVYLFKGTDPYTYIREVGNVSDDGVDELWIEWSNSNDCWLLSTNKLTIRKTDVCNRDRTTTLKIIPTAASNNARDFSTLVDTASNPLKASRLGLVIKPYQYCNISDDDTRFASKIVDGNGTVYGFGLFQYDLNGGTVKLNWFHKLTSPGDLVNQGAPANKRPANACISPDGDMVVVQWNTSNTGFNHYGTEQYRASDGARVARSHTNGTVTLDEVTHSDMGRLAGGGEAYETSGCGALHNDYRRWSAFDLNPSTNSSCTPPTDAVSAWLPDASLLHSWHISGRANIGPANPMNGWVLISGYANTFVDQVPQVPMGSELFALHMDGSNEVRRIAHEQSCPAEGAGGPGYFAEPHASPNRTFTKAIWASSWRKCTANTPIYTFIVELPVASTFPSLSN